MKIVYIAYNYHPGYTSPEEWIRRIRPFSGVMEYLAMRNTVIYAGKINYAGNLTQNGVQYHFYGSGRGRSKFPRHLHREVRNMQPDVIIIPGLHFPLQVIQLRRQVGKKVKIIAEHHADKPPAAIKRKLQQWADHCIDAYHFTSLGNAQPWKDAGIIRKAEKCREIPAGSSEFIRQNKEACKRDLQMGEGPDFIWVGRMNINKDPMTILAAFEKYFQSNQAATLHMIYQEDDLLPLIKTRIEKSETLKMGVRLHGLKRNSELERWYNASDFFISGSHSESGGIALLEAMSCGCIPVVTAIPSSLKATHSGQFGLHFRPGDPEDLYEKLLSTEKISLPEFSKAVEGYFQQEFSFEAIARKIYHSIELLMSE